MADTVAVTILRDTPNVAQLLLTGVSDGTGESAVTKIDIDGTLTNFSATKTQVSKIKWAVIGEAVKLTFDHTTPQVIGIFSYSGKLDEDHEAPIIDGGGTGGTGDIKLTTIGQASNSAYMLFIELRKLA